jgi:hypothetical protein
MTEEEIDALKGRKCRIIGVYKSGGDPIFKILDAWEDNGDIRILLDPPCVDGGTTVETVSYNQILLVDNK